MPDAMRVQFQYNQSDSRYLTDFIHKNSQRTYARLDATQALSPLLLLISAAAFMWINALRSVSYFTGITILMAMVFGILAIALFVTMFVPRISRRKALVLPEGEFHISISPEGLHWRAGDAGEELITWPTIAELRDDQNGIYMLLGKNKLGTLPWYMIPKRAFPFEESAATFYERVRQYVLSVETEGPRVESAPMDPTAGPPPPIC